MDTTTSQPNPQPDANPTPDPISSLPSELRILTLNCWGLKYISLHRQPRLHEIGRQLSLLTPAPHIVALQECWTQADYLSIRQQTSPILPHAKFYHSGIFGGGLLILSKWPIEESSMHRYPLNGRPTAFFRGDWFVGKGVAAARIRIAGPEGDLRVEVFNTHLHAPYEREPDDSYLCHRTAQAWEIGKLMRGARERGSVVLGVGDFNLVPASLGHRLVEGCGGVRDLWRVVKPDSAVGAARSEVERVRRGPKPVPTVEGCIRDHGTTCDSALNTWRWSKEMRKALERGREVEVDLQAEDERARRLDYIFFGAPEEQGWEVERVGVGMTMRHPTLRCSLSDHFSVEATLRRRNTTATPSSTVSNGSSGSGRAREIVSPLPLEVYDTILSMISSYMTRERQQRHWRLAHFGAQIAISIACFIAVWWSPRPFVAFILMLVSTLGFGAGVVDGLIGGLFVGSEIRALKEFEWEIRNARTMAERRAVVDDDAKGP